MRIIELNIWMMNVFQTYLNKTYYNVLQYIIIFIHLINNSYLRGTNKFYAFA